jgi:hypothetical protein
MARSKVVEIDYYQFVTLLRRASDTGKRIDKTDARWKETIKAQGINEVAATAIARQKFERAVPVILAEGRETDVLYCYSQDEECCLRLVSLE